MEIKITVNDNKFSLKGGLVSAQQIYDAANIADEFFFVQGDGCTVQVNPSDFLIMKSNGIFRTGCSHAEGLKSSRNPIGIHYVGKTSEYIQLPSAKVSGQELLELDRDLTDGRIFVSIDEEWDREISKDMRIILQEGDTIIVTPSGEGNFFGDPIDIETCGKHNRQPPKGKSYKIRVDHKKIVIGDEKILGKHILSIVGKRMDEWKLLMVLSGGEQVGVGSDEEVYLTDLGINLFKTVRYSF